MGLGVAILIAEDCILAEVRVADLEALDLGIRDDRVNRDVRGILFLIENDGVTM